MTRLIAPEVIDKTLKGISIPARPQVLVQLQGELKKNDPDPRVIVRLIGADAGLSAAVLKTVNSPFFGLPRRISSVAQAVGLLGMSASAQIVTGLLLRTAIGGKAANTAVVERFWDNAEKMAGISRQIATSLPAGPRDDAYCFGLFHDLGVPILIERFPGYQQTLLLADNVSDRPFTAVEQEQHGTDHATLGYLVAKGWFLPETICEAIRYHHDLSIFDERDAASPGAMTLIAINALAHHVHDEHVRLHDTSAWATIGSRALAHLGLTADEYADLREHLTMMDQ